MDRNKYDEDLYVKDSHITEEELFAMFDESIRQIENGEYYTEEEIEAFFGLKFD